MSPRRPPISMRTDVCSAARAVSSSPRRTCQYTVRVTRAIDPTPNTTSRNRSRRRESVRPSISALGRSAGREDDGLAELAEATIQGELADRRFTAQPAQVRGKVLTAGLQPLLVDLEAADVVARRRHADFLRQREEGEHECDRDAPQDDRRPTRAAMRTDRRTCSSARQYRGLGGPRAARERDRAWAGALVDGHGSVAGREAEARRARVEERQRIRRRGGAPRIQLERGGVVVGRTLVSLAHLVLAAAVGLATARLVALAHRGLLR